MKILKTTIHKQYTFIVFILLASITMVSCASKPQKISFKITQDNAFKVINDSIGLVEPKINLFHTYEENWQSSYWDNRNGSSVKSINSKITFYKIEGNYVEGKMTVMHDGKLHGNYDIAGRFNDKYLYLYRSGGNLKYYSQTPRTYYHNKNLPNLAIYEIGEGSRIFYLKNTLWLTWGYTYNNTTNQWVKPLELDTDLYSYDKTSKEVIRSTGFVSSTDDYLGEKRKEKSSGSEQSMTEKLKELKSLFDNGLITKEEYDSLRKKIIN